MRTTADPREAFAQIDATDIDSDSYTFSVDDGNTPVSVMEEGEEFSREELNIRSIDVSFEDYSNKSSTQMALDAIRTDSMAHLAGEMLPTEYSYDLLFIDREDERAYLIDTNRFGYNPVREMNEDGDPIKGAFVGIYPDACLRIR